MRNDARARNALVFLGRAALTVSLGTIAMTAQTVRPVVPEAQSVAKRVWDSILTKCGSSYFYNPAADSSFYSRPHAPIEYRDTHFYVFPRVVSPADKLNGIQWHGSAVMTASLYRADKGTGSDWQDGAPLPAKKDLLDFYVQRQGGYAGYDDIPAGWFVVSMEKMQGVWRFGWAGKGERTFEDIPDLKPSCSDDHETVAQRKELDAKNAEERLRQSLATHGWTDATTQLSWALLPRNPNRLLNREKAAAYCQNLTFDGYNNWQLPGAAALATLLDDIPPPVASLLEKDGVILGWTNEGNTALILQATNGVPKGARTSVRPGLGQSSPLCVHKN